MLHVWSSHHYLIIATLHFSWVLLLSMTLKVLKEIENWDFRYLYCLLHVNYINSRYLRNTLLPILRSSCHNLLYGNAVWAVTSSCFWWRNRKMDLRRCYWHNSDICGWYIIFIYLQYLSFFKEIFFFLKIYFFKQILFVADVISQCIEQWIDVTGYLLGAGKPYYALALLALIIPQVIFQVKHLQRFFTVEVKVQHRIFSVSFYCSWVFVWLYLGVKLSYNSLGFIP